MALAVLGLGLLVGAFLRTGRGLIPFALLLIALTWAVLSAPVDRWRGGEVGELRAAPTTVAALLPVYERSAGEIDLDLRELDLPPRSAPRPRSRCGPGSPSGPATCRSGCLTTPT